MGYKKIDKAIAEINKCNNKIEMYKKDNSYLDIAHDKEYIKKVVKQCLWAGVLGGLTGFILGPLGLPISIFIGAYMGGQTGRDEDGKYYPKIILDLEKENNKALKWLKKEKERIENGTAEKKKIGKVLTGKQESTYNWNGYRSNIKNTVNNLNQAKDNHDNAKKNLSISKENQKNAEKSIDDMLRKLQQESSSIFESIELI